MYRLPYSPGLISLVWLVLVLFDPVRSADPPIVSGTTPLITSSAISDDLRVATFGLSATSFCLYTPIAASSPSGKVPAVRLSNSALTFESAAASRFCQSARLPAEALPALRQASRISAGNSNGGRSQPKNLRAPAISSAPSGEPCALAVPALVGAPQPIVVLAAMSV